MESSVKKLFTLGLLALAGAANAGTCQDPWVTQAVTEVTKRAPNGSGSSGECDIKRYGGGRWSSYPDLVSKVKVAFGTSAPSAPSAGSCKDPWVTQAVTEVMKRAPKGSGTSGECDIYRYGGGRWSSYPDLVSKVKTAFGMNIAGSAKPGSGGNNLGSLNPSQNGGRVVSPGGGNVISPGGGNVISPGGGNVISPGGGNVISTGGGNMRR